MADPYAQYYDDEESYYQQPRTQSQGLITPSIKLRPYTPDTSWLTGAGRALSNYQMPVQSRGDFYANMLARLAGNFMGQMGRQEEEDQTRGAYKRLAGILSGPDVGSRIAEDPDFYDVAPSILLDEYKRKGKLADTTAMQEMLTREGQRREFFDVDPETHQTSYFPGYVASVAGGKGDIGFAENYGKEAGKLSAQGELGERARIAMHGVDDATGGGRVKTTDIIPGPLPLSEIIPPGTDEETAKTLSQPKFTWEGKFPTIDQLRETAYNKLADTVRAQGGKVTTDTQKLAESSVAPFRKALTSEEKDIQKEYAQVEKARDALNNMESAVSDAGITGTYMGIPQWARTGASRLLGTFSKDAADKAKATDLLQSSATEFSRSLRTPGEGPMMKSDEVAYMSISPNKDYSPDVNRKILEQKKAAYDRKLAHIKFRDDLVQRGYSPDVVRNLWTDFITNNPLYKKTETGYKVNHENISPENYFLKEKPIPVPGAIPNDMKRLPGETYAHWQTRTGG